jgi:hypothetical protein
MQNHAKKHHAPVPNPKVKTQLYAEKHHFLHLFSAAKNQAARALETQLVDYGAVRIKPLPRSSEEGSFGKRVCLHGGKRPHPRRIKVDFRLRNTK